MSSKQEQAKKNNILDKFYTRPQVAEKCVDQIDNHIEFNKGEIIIEPSAGNGIFIDSLNDYFSPQLIIGYDIKPDREDIKQQDFLKLDLKKTFKDTPLHFVGNPPFGRSSKLCRLFIKNMCSNPNTKSISLILPISYHKNFNQRTSFNKKFHLVYEEILGKNSFTNEAIDKKVFNVAAVFQIWERREENRIDPAKILPKGFTYEKNYETADFAICHKGNAASNIVDLYDSNNVGPIIESPSYTFIRLTQSTKNIINVKNFMNTFQKIGFKNFKFYDMGSHSVNKQEMAYELNKCILFVNVMCKYFKFKSILEKFDNMIEMCKLIVNC